jgi:hypothetical protein
MKDTNNIKNTIAITKNRNYTKIDLILNWFFNTISPLELFSIIFFFAILFWMLFPIKPIDSNHYPFIIHSFKYFFIYIGIVIAFFIYRHSPKIYKGFLPKIILKMVFKLSPFITGTFIYENLKYIIPSVNSYNFDFELFKFDSFIVGNDASRILESLWSNVFIEFMAFFYIFYFVVLYLSFLKKFFRKDPLFDLFISGFGVTFLIAFFLNVVFPSLGPKFFFPSDFYSYDLVSGQFMNYCDKMIEHLSGGYQAFPSLHFGGPAFILLFDFFHSRRRFWVWLIPTILVWTSAIFLRYHYLADHIGGLIIVIFSLWFTPRFMIFYTKKADYYRNKTNKKYTRTYYMPLDYFMKNPKYHNDKEWL